jgi:hypothetical protein
MIVVLHLAAALKETGNDAANPSGAAHALGDDHTLWVFAARIADLEKDRGRLQTPGWAAFRGAGNPTAA